MISKIRLPIKALAVLFCVTTASAAFWPAKPNPENRDDRIDPRRPQRPIEPAIRR